MEKLHEVQIKCDRKHGSEFRTRIAVNLSAKKLRPRSVTKPGPQQNKAEKSFRFPGLKPQIFIATFRGPEEPLFHQN
jgi:hypothetical protein